MDTYRPFDYIDAMSEEKKKSRFRRAFDNVVNEASEVGNDTVRDVKELRDKHVAPILRMGKNRVIAAGMGAKTGFFLGMKAGPKGILVGTFVGAAAGFVGGPKVLEKVERAIGIKPEGKEPANDNKQEAEIENKIDPPDSRPPDMKL